MANDAGAAGGPDVRVQVSGLTGLADRVRADNDATMRPRLRQAETAFAPGTPFGARSASGYVYAAKDAYRRAVVHTVDVLDAYVRAAEVLATAAETVARNYRNADALAAAHADDVTRALEEASAHARAAQQRSGGGRAVPP